MKHRILNFLRRSWRYFKRIFLHDKNLKRDAILLGLTILASGIFLVSSLDASMNFLPEEKPREEFVDPMPVVENIENSVPENVSDNAPQIENVEKPAPVVKKVSKPRAPMPITFKKSSDGLVCDKKNDHPKKSNKHKGKHMDMECCLDPDEYPNPNCHYSKSKYGKYL